MAQVWQTFVSLLLVGSTVYAGDWPQILGPHRNGQAEDEKLASNWVGQKPTLRWQARVGSGFAGPAVVGHRVLVFHRSEDRETLVCLTTDQGKSMWDVSWPATYRGGVSPDLGPRCVPIVDGRRVFVFGADGDLHAADLETGKQLWSRELTHDYQASDGYFGIGSTPIMVRGKLLVNVGGRQGAGIVALDPQTGKTLWKALDDEASYASPTWWTSGQKQHAIFVTRLSAVGIDADSGQEIFRIPFGRRGPTVNAATPLVIGPRHLFLTASYGTGAQLMELGPGPTRTVWSGDEMLSSQYPTPVFYDGFLFGVHGREDGPPAALRCVEAMTGKVRWKKPAMGMAHCVLADGKLIVLRTEGELLLVKPTPEEYQELGRHRVSNAITRASPALARGHLYVRNTAGQITSWTLPR